MRTVPEVVAASAVSGGVPLTGSWSRNRIELPGKSLVGSDDALDRRTVTPEYLQTLGIPLLRGRHLSVEDREGSPKVAVINETAAKKYWPDTDALGQTFKMNSQDYTVIGIVGDIRHLGPEMPARQESYVPLAQNTVVGIALVMRTRGDALAVLPAVKSAIWSVNKEQRIGGDVFTMEGYMDRLIAQRRFNMTLLALFGVLGLALGGVIAWYASAVVRTFLFQTEPNDVSTMIAALGVLSVAGLLASAVPARRAASVDPLIALRHE